LIPNENDEIFSSSGQERRGKQQREETSQQQRVSNSRQGQQGEGGREVVAKAEGQKKIPHHVATMRHVEVDKVTVLVAAGTDTSGSFRVGVD
jgi:hypothetical protein